MCTGMAFRAHPRNNLGSPLPRGEKAALLKIGFSEYKEQQGNRSDLISQPSASFLGRCEKQGVCFAGYVMGKLGEEMEREPGSRHEPRDLAGTPHLLSPLRRHSGNGTAPLKRQGQAEGLTFLLCDGAEAGVAGLGGRGLLVRGAARGRPPPRQALHGPRLHAASTAGRALREAQATVAQGHQVLWPAALASSPPPAPRLLTVVCLNHCGSLSRFWIFPRYGHWGEVPRSLNVLESSRV